MASPNPFTERTRALLQPQPTAPLAGEAVRQFAWVQKTLNYVAAENRVWFELDLDPLFPMREIFVYQAHDSGGLDYVVAGRLDFYQGEILVGTVNVESSQNSVTALMYPGEPGVNFCPRLTAPQSAGGRFIEMQRQNGFNTTPVILYSGPPLKINCDRVVYRTDKGNDTNLVASDFFLGILSTPET